MFDVISAGRGRRCGGADARCRCRACRPPHFSAPGVRVWITDPPGELDIIDDQLASAEHIRFVLDAIDRALFTHPLHHTEGKLWFVHDYRCVHRYESNAREQWTAFSRKFYKRAGRCEILVSPEASLMLMGAGVVASILRVLGVELSVKPNWGELPDGVLKPAAHLEQRRAAGENIGSLDITTPLRAGRASSVVFGTDGSSRPRG